MKNIFRPVNVFARMVLTLYYPRTRVHMCASSGTHAGTYACACADNRHGNESHESQTSPHFRGGKATHSPSFFLFFAFAFVSDHVGHTQATTTGHTHEKHAKPRGPKDQKNSRFRSRLKISIKNEIFERATHRGPIFCGGNRDVEIEIFERDQKFRSRLKVSIEIKFFRSSGPLGIPEILFGFRFRNPTERTS